MQILILQSVSEIVEEFQTYYWNTRVVGAGGCWGRFSYGNRYYYEGHSNQFPIGKFQIRPGSKVIDHQEDRFLCDEHTRHVALHFNSTSIDRILDYDFQDSTKINNLPSSFVPFMRSPTIVPEKPFVDICKHIIKNVPNLKSLYLWLTPSLQEAEEILSAPADQPTPLVNLIRQIPVNKQGKFIVRLVINPWKQDMFSPAELAQIEMDEEGEEGEEAPSPFVKNWDGLAGPERYGNLCREMEKKFEGS